jgi:hypothetical protein
MQPPLRQSYLRLAKRAAMRSAAVSCDPSIDSLSRILRKNREEIPGLAMLR